MFTILRQTAICAGLLTSACLAVPASAQTCVDSDGDGWGWNGTQSCLASTLSAVACVDLDGDGFGWDGQASCIVGQATEQPLAPTEQLTTTDLSCVDTDGDGWGWNGQASCQTNRVSVEPVVETTPESTPESMPEVIETPSTNANGFSRERDLLAIHFDHSPDRDDGHAAVAAKMVTNKLGLNVQVVAGTYGEYSRDRYDAESESVMAAVWGSNWLNAHQNRENAVNAAVNRWAAVLATGGNIWVAEGGPSDFTALVVQQINQLHTEFNTTNRIRVIQHSTWNEDHSLGEALSYTRSNTRYINIEDGNNPNATADLRFESHNNGAFVSRALSSAYSAEWTAALNYLSAAEKLDFSDVVEMLYIVGLGTEIIADINDFGDYFF